MGAPYSLDLRKRVVAAVAPRPVLVLSGPRDGLVPLGLS